MNNPEDKPELEVIAERYQLDARIHDGPHAVIWHGFDLQDQTAIVLKIFKPGQIGSIEEFEAHMRQVMPLKFSGLLSVRDYSIGEQEGFVVYDCKEGANLRDFAVRLILSNQQVIRWMIDLGETLEYVHSKGLLHQNITPANILIDLDGQPLLTDFGTGASPSQIDPKSRSYDEMKYLSPEQLEGQFVGPSSDLFSLAVVMYELLTGQLPYHSVDPKALRSEILRGAHVDNDLTPYELRRFFKKALARNPHDRYTTAEQFVTALRKVLVGGATRRWAVATVGVILFIGGFAISDRMWGAKAGKQQAGRAVGQEWIEQVKQQPADKQFDSFVAKLKLLNPGFDGEVNKTIEQNQVVELVLSTDHIKDISPLKALTELKSLTCIGTYSTQSNGKLVDLSPLKGLGLTSLIIHNNEPITDLSPLAGMPLTFLDCGRTSVSDLTPLKDSPLEVLVCRHTNVASLTPIAGMKLKELYCDHTEVTDLSPLDGMPLEELHCEDTPVANLTPLKHCPLKVLDCYHTLVSDLEPLRVQHELTSLNLLSTRVTDLSPLKDLPKIKLLWCDFDEKQDRELLKSLNSLQFINDNPVSIFWKEASRTPP